ncbi:hypothetical protein, partial [Methanosarcina mazei]|uniref:hypothetical protein n=1 Tax=Methanosarcina mazei TaxID=2209 RepID=UPI001C307E29
MMQDVLVIFAFFIILLSIVIALIKDLSSWVYITILLAIASWLLLFPQILSPYVVGIDAHFEHIIAEETLRTGHWDPDLSGNIVNAALSITILTPFISIVSGIPLDWVLKIILTIYPLISIPIIWKSNIHILSFSNRESFLSLLLLIGTSSFMLISVYGRQEVGLFSGLVLLYFLHFKKSSVQLSIVLIFLVIGLIFSHYSTAIILIITYAISSLFLYLFQRDKCSMRLVLFSIVFMVFWLILIVYASMASI